MKKFAIHLLFFALVLFFACQNKHKDTQNESEKTEYANIGKLDDDVKRTLLQLFSVYLEVKDALVASDAKLAKSKAGEFELILDSLTRSKMTPEQQNVFKPIAEKLKSDAQKMQEKEDLVSQRAHLEMLSNHVWTVLKSFQTKDKTIYKQFCPMAFDDKGASWLSDKSEVRNPYFGDEMLKCGKVTEEW
jgi:hypothetical protein